MYTDDLYHYSVKYPAEWTTPGFNPLQRNGTNGEKLSFIQTSSGFMNECMKDEYKSDSFTETEIDKKIADKNSVNYLIKTIVDYMVQNPSYSDPELLHKVVDIGHYAACQDSETSNIARQAFQLLHSRYPGNYWIKQTPYWY